MSRRGTRRAIDRSMSNEEGERERTNEWETDERGGARAGAGETRGVEIGAASTGDARRDGEREERATRERGRER